MMIQWSVRVHRGGDYVQLHLIASHLAFANLVHILLITNNQVFVLKIPETNIGHSRPLHNFPLELVVDHQAM